LYYLIAKRYLGNFRMESGKPLTAVEALERLERANQTALELEVRDKDGRTISLEELRKKAAAR
jgi:hypothetical protein